MPTVYKVKGNNTDLIFGKGQLVEYATQQLAENLEYFKSDKLKLHYEPSELKLLSKIITDVMAKGKTINKQEHAMLVLGMKGLAVTKVELY